MHLVELRCSKALHCSKYADYLFSVQREQDNNYAEY